jgi:hypothetical protein
MSHGAVWAEKGPFFYRVEREREPIGEGGEEGEEIKEVWRYKFARAFEVTIVTKVNH